MERRSAPAGDRTAVVDRLVRLGIHEDVPAATSQNGDDGHMNMRDRGQHKRVLGPKQRCQPFLDVDVGPRVAEKS